MPRRRRRGARLRLVAAGWYSGILNGVSGASGFSKGSVAIHASNAGWNSGRNRASVEVLEELVLGRVRIDPLDVRRHVDLRLGLGQALRAGGVDPQRVRTAPRLDLFTVPTVRLIAAPRGGDRREREQHAWRRSRSRSRFWRRSGAPQPSGLGPGLGRQAGFVARQRRVESDDFELLVDDAQRSLHRDRTQRPDTGPERIVEELQQQQQRRR